MANLNTCPTCHTEFESSRSSAGLCPKCLLRGASPVGQRNQAEMGHATQSYDAGAAAQTPVMKPAQVDQMFPELEVLDVIGQGGMGVVYKAKQKNLGREVALKLLSSNLMDNPAFAERFSREARAMAMMNHPNIIAIYDFGQRGSHYYLVMEYVDGLNLRQLIHGTNLEPAEAMQMVPQLCDALQYAHDRGIVHRDIKPENVLISQDGHVKIADFGLAKLTDGTPGNITLTQSRQVMGTLNYMAPEQVERPMTVDHRADIYSLGVVIYELLTGELPLGRFSMPSEKASIDARLDEVVLRALEKDPSLRYQQASEFKTGLQSVSSAGPFVKQFGGTKNDQAFASKIGKFVWLALAMTLCIAGGITVVVGAVTDNEDRAFPVGFILAGVGALLFALCGVFESVFGDEDKSNDKKLQDPELPAKTPKQPPSPFATLLLWIGIALMAGAYVAHRLFDIEDMVAFCVFISGLVLICFRTLFVQNSSSKNNGNTVATPAERGQDKPMPIWLVGVKMVAIACFFACPLFFIGSAFADNRGFKEWLRFMGIAAPIAGAFVSAIVGMIARNNGYRNED